MTKKAIFFLLISLSYCSNDGPEITDDTLAAVNNRTITTDDFSNQTQSILGSPGIDLSTKDGKINVVKDMINEELVFQQALKEEYHLKNLDIKHEIVREYLKNKFEKELPKVTEEQVTNFYKDHQGEIDLIRANHILIAIKDKENKKEKSDAKSKAEQVRSEIVSGKISFKDAVKKYSGDPGTADKHGDLGFFPRVKMVEPFANAAFALKKIGDISLVVETEFGFHIIQLTGEQRGFDLYKERIQWKLSQDVIQPKINEYFRTIREPAKIKIFTDKIDNALVPIQ